MVAEEVGLFCDDSWIYRAEDQEGNLNERGLIHWNLGSNEAVRVD
jgi:hypothetical protein